jgi:hypothetical protein
VLVVQIGDKSGKVTGVACEVVDGERIKADTFYQLVDDKFVAVSEVGI